MRTHVPMVVGALCALMAMGTAPAAAQGADAVTQTQRVSYSDLDLNSEAGAATYLARLEQAAEQVCRYHPRDNWRLRRQAQACVHEAMDHAVHVAASETLSAQYANSGYGRGSVGRTAPLTQQVTYSARPRSTSTRAIGMDVDQVMATVSYADLDLDSADGRAQFERRLMRATRRVCSDNAMGRRWSSEHRACVQQARADARTQMAAVLDRRQYAAVQTTPEAVMTEAPHVEAGGPQLIAAAATTAHAPAPALHVETTAAPASNGYGVCAAREHNAGFAGRSSTLSRDARLEIGYAVDAASVCALEAAVIAANANDPLSQRRASALRAALIARGVPANRIVVESTDDTSALGQRVRMNFSGVAHSGDEAEVMPAGV
ncbi:MAG: UrcA family protein [Hyphomonadaceae bacterium]